MGDVKRLTDEARALLAKPGNMQDQEQVFRLIIESLDLLDAALERHR